MNINPDINFNNVQHFKSIDSTNAEAHRYLENKNTQKPLWFLADKQDAGRGRMGSRWISNEGNLFCSLIYPINWDLKLMPMISALVAVVIHETISFFIGNDPKLKIKWPNDILINDAKISGALIENIIGGENKYTIIGIGINILSSPKLDIYQTAFINEFLNTPINVKHVFLKLKVNLENKLKDFSTETVNIIRHQMLNNAWKINENVNYISNSIESSGFFENISENYEIIIRTETNQVKLSSGELKLIRD